MIIQKNIPALRTLKEQNQTIKATSKNLERLSSGFRINRAADDAAGLAISEKMRAKITELSRCQINAQEGLDIARSADGALAEVNTMLRRAHSLCIKASNGTYSESERSKLSDEMNEIFDEIDRITAGTTFNDIRLFRGDVEEEYYWEIVEDFNKLPPGQLATWGEMNFIKSEDFDPAPKAEPAKVSFELDDSIELNDKNTLEGKSIKIGSRIYLFSSTPVYTIEDRYGSDTIRIPLSRYTTAKDALKALTSYPSGSSSSDIKEVEIDENTKTVTLTAKLQTLSYPVTADGKTVNFSASDGNAEYMNDVVVQNPLGDAPISQVDGTGAVNNQPVDSKIVTGTVSLLSDKANNFTIGNLLTDLNQNKIILSATGTGGSPRTIELNTLGLTATTTKQQLGQAIAQAINSSNTGATDNLKYTASYDATKGGLSIKLESLTNPITNLSIYEQTYSGGRTEGTKWTSTSLGVTSKITTPSSPELSQTAEITLPSDLKGSAPFSFTVRYPYSNGTSTVTYLYYDSSKNPLTYGDFNQTDYTTYCNVINVQNMTEDQIKNNIFTIIRQFAERSGASAGGVTMTGNTITATAPVGSKISPSFSVSGTTITVTPYKNNTSSRVLDLRPSLTQNTTVSFSLGNSFNKDSLIGKGFSIIDTSSNNPSRFEFTNGNGGKHFDYTDIDISTCTDFPSLQQKINDVMKTKNSDWKATIDTNGKMSIDVPKNISYSFYVMDGAEGIMKNGPVRFSGGKNAGYSHKEIDFSSINSDNVNTLLGKGFRINCATCSGEYINVLFCWENDGSLPPSFQRPDEETGEIRTIHNIPVELSKITSGDKIVEDIVRQVKPSLNHYTNVEVGDPPTILIARDKRLGDVVDPNNPNKIYLGKVQTGVETNFTYDAEEKEEVILPGGENETVFLNTEVKIYVGSDPSPQYIPIHLPYLDLTYLKLDPPEWVDFNDPEQDAGDWLTRVDQANMAIASARGTIGADYNRLEYAFNDLCNYEENLTYAESLIRDADFAHEKMKQIKNQILSQSQQAMLSQASAMPQQVLQLLQ